MVTIFRNPSGSHIVTVFRLVVTMFYLETKHDEDVQWKERIEMLRKKRKLALEARANQKEGKYLLPA